MKLNLVTFIATLLLCIVSQQAYSSCNNSTLPAVAVVETEVCQYDNVHLVFSGIAPFALDYTFNGTRQSINVAGLETTLTATQPGENLFIVHGLLDADGCLPTDLDEGTELDGVVWATRNVDLPETFTETPEGIGMFYQWGKNVGWSTSDPMINSNGSASWDASFPTGTSWLPENDPCPCGWRMPSKDEQENLKNKGSIVITQNGVEGRLFGNAVFLPYAHGWRETDGTLTPADHGDYWTGTQENAFAAWDFCFDDGIPHQIAADKRFSASLRCVKDTQPCPRYTHTVTVFPVKTCKPEPPLTIPEGISPNDDGINDKFEITGIENYPQNSIVIFNRWGNKVFEAAPYRNNFNGFTNSGHSLPTGIYFYVLNLGDGSQVLKGCVYLNK